LDVIVSVNENGRGVFAGLAVFTYDDRVPWGFVNRCFKPSGLERLLNPLGSLASVSVVLRLSADARDAKEIEKFFFDTSLVLSEILVEICGDSRHNDCEF
jgi:hypothetical protein